jgi:hypothetical protein
MVFFDRLMVIFDGIMVFLIRKKECQQFSDHKDMKHAKKTKNNHIGLKKHPKHLKNTQNGLNNTQNRPKIAQKCRKTPQNH